MGRLREYRSIFLLTFIMAAVALDPENGAFLDSLGWAYFRLGDLKQAWAYLRRALENMDEDYAPREQAVILQHAGDVAQALGNTATARSKWRAALQLTPEDEELRDKLQALPQNAP